MKIMLILSVLLFSLTFVSAYSNGYSMNSRYTIKPIVCNCDVNKDHVIDQKDYNIVFNDFGFKVNEYHFVSSSDVDNSGTIGLRDLKLVQKYQGADLRWC